MCVLVLKAIACMLPASSTVSRECKAVYEVDELSNVLKKKSK